jgi:ABC-2 type transport system permease protein
MIATALRHTWFMSQRQMRALFRQPVWIALTLVQPIIWILLYGQLFKRITGLGSFGTDEYITFLTPGIVIMTALFSGGWNGFGVIEDINQGVMDRFLVTPASRSAIILGRMVQLAIIAVIQSLILLTIGFVMGADYSGPLGIVVLILAAVLLGRSRRAVDRDVGRAQEETVIAAVNFVVLPLTFLSTLFLPCCAAGWIERATFNPVNWRSAVAARFPTRLGAGRRASGSRPAHARLHPPGHRAFRSYQRSVNRYAPRSEYGRLAIAAGTSADRAHHLDRRSLALDATVEVPWL